jgi:hypothetical protein
MSGDFSADWLILREPYDRAACSKHLLDRLAAWCAGKGELRVIDLGAGTGANLRRTAARLGGAQHWLLVEHDPALIQAGTALLAGSGVAWRYRRLDLAADLEKLADEAPHLVAASALIDLVSEDWLRRLVVLCACTGAALHLALSYDGRTLWQPADADDAWVTALFNRHQRTDKGFGPALGPEAVPVLRRLLAEAPGELSVAASDWRLASADRGLQEALLKGQAAAACAIAPERQEAIAAWADRRQAIIAAGGSRLTIGHLDLLFLPAGHAESG